MKQAWIYRLVVLTVLASVLFCGCKEKEKPEIFSSRTPVQQKETETKEETGDVTEYRLEELNMEEGTITLRSLSSGKRVRYTYSLATKFLDRYGERSNIMKFTPGQIVQLGSVSENSVLRSVQMSDRVWNYEDVRKYDIDTESGILTIGKTKYRITTGTAVFSDEEKITLADVGSDDTLYVIGKDREILSIMVTTGHGYLQFIHTDLFRDSLICIGNRIFTTLAGDTVMEVPEGSYDITVANKGYGGTANYVVMRNEITTVDLDLLRGEGPKICKIKFTTEVEDAKVTIDGTEVPVGQELDVTYGSHVLRVTAPGYSTWKKTLIVNSPSATISLDLSDETEKDTSGSASTGSSASGSGTLGSTTSGGTTSNNGTSGSSSSGKTTDAEVDYLTTISEMLKNLLN